jgi:hypothetical protein
MFKDQRRELEEIANLLAEARERLENLQSSKNLPGTNALHNAISHAHWLCHRVYDGVPPEATQALRAFCGN